jgi:hypothetical protein
MTSDMAAAIGMPLFVFALLSGIALIIWAASSHANRSGK